MIKINVVESVSKIGIANEAKQMVSKNPVVRIDGKTSYRVFDNILKKHKAVIVKDKSEITKIFPWMHITIRNVKKKTLGLQHSVKDTYSKRGNFFFMVCSMLLNVDSH